MRLALPPLDTHAHVDTSVEPTMLRKLRSVVVAVTREPSEWNAALARTDPSTLWAIGVHPGVARALDHFDVAQFRRALAATVFVGEVGLDGRAKTNGARQAEVFDAVLDELLDAPRPVTIHSTAAHGEVLAALQARSVVAPILHWWRGTPAQTTVAVELGCYFSVNAHEVANPRALDLIPRARVLTETDYPHTRRYDPTATRPGSVNAVETHLELSWDTDRIGVRRQLWHNFGSLLTRTGVIDRMPRTVLASLATAGFEG